MGRLGACMAGTLTDLLVVCLALEAESGPTPMDVEEDDDEEDDAKDQVCILSGP